MKKNAQKLQYLTYTHLFERKLTIAHAELLERKKQQQQQQKNNNNNNQKKPSHSCVQSLVRLPEHLNLALFGLQFILNCHRHTMAATRRSQAEMQRKCKQALATGQTKDPIERMRLQLLERGCSGIKAIGRLVLFVFYVRRKSKHQFYICPDCLADGCGSSFRVFFSCTNISS